MDYRHGAFFTSHTGTTILILGQILILGHPRGSTPRVRGLLVPGLPYQEWLDIARKYPGGWLEMPYLKPDGSKGKQFMARVVEGCHLDEDGLAPGEGLRQLLEHEGNEVFKQALALTKDDFEDETMWRRYAIELVELNGTPWAAEVLGVNKNTLRGQVGRWRKALKAEGSNP